MSKLVPPHGGKGLVCCLLEGKALEDELQKAKGLKQIEISSRAKGDLIMMGIGGFSPLDGFMDKANWKSVCDNMLLTDGTFWPVPITMDISAEDAKDIKPGQEVALVRNGTIYATMKVSECYEMTDEDKKYECEKVFKGHGPDSEKFWEIAPTDHPGVKMVLAQKPFNLAGKVKVLSQGEFPTKFAGTYMTPAQLRAEMDKLSSKSVTADMFISTVRKYTRAKVLTPRMLNELIDHIEVHQAEKIDGIWEQHLVIHYNCVGAIFIPDVFPLPAPQVSVNTRKGVVVNYAPGQLAV